MRILIEWIVSNWVSLLALIISGFAAYFAYEQSQTAKRLSHFHIMPSIKCMFDFPAQGNPIITIINDGDIPAVSLSVAHNTYVYDKASKYVVAASKAGFMFTDKMIYRKELGPTEYVKQELVRVEPIDRVIGVYDFYIKFYRASDMKELVIRKLFFVDDGKAHDHSTYLENPNYLKIMAEIEKTEIPSVQYDPGKLKEVLEKLEKSKKSRSE